MSNVFSIRRHMLAMPVLTAACVAGLLCATPAAAQGDLLIAPTRLVLDGRQGGQVILSNIGDQEATYRISLELRRMTPEGELVDVAPEDANAAEKAALAMVRYAPRRITLPPDQPQAVRISARPAPELPDGEYRVHLAFNALPVTRSVAEDQSAPATGLAVKLIPIYGITMPLIVRKGQVEATAALVNPRVVPGPAGGASLMIDMMRGGTGSTYGEIRVLKPGSAEPVYLARGIAIYPEIAQRKLTLPLTPEQAAAMKGPLRFEYRELPENGGRLLASTEAAIR